LPENVFCRAGLLCGIGHGRDRRRPVADARDRTPGDAGGVVTSFAAVGLCNGFAVLCWVQSLALGPVSLISPAVACYPVFTLVFGAVLLRKTKIGGNQMLGVALTVAGVVVLTAA
jgi:drug/metabolite transporter (DMT)-like permease